MFKDKSEDVEDVDRVLAGFEIVIMVKSILRPSGDTELSMNELNSHFSNLLENEG